MTRLDRILTNIIDRIDRLEFCLLTPDHESGYGDARQIREETEAVKQLLNEVIETDSVG